MKEKLFGGLALVFMAALWFQCSTVQASSLDRWDLTKEYTVEKDSVKYYAYLSKDKKESWIYKAELIDEKKMLNVIFPDKVESLPVTCLGVTRDLADTIDVEINKWGYYTLFYKLWEPHYDHGKRPDPLITNVRSVILPDTVTEMGDATFACMSNLKTVHLPKNITTLVKFMFYGCKDLQRIEFAPEVEVPDSTIFQYCDGLKGLMEESEFRREGMTITCQGNMIINKSEKILIQVMPTAKKITIPAHVKEIEPAAFTGSSLQKVKAAKKNKNFAVHGRCLYNKKNGKLILVFGKGSKLTFSKKIKKIDKHVMIAKYKIKKLVLPSKVKRSSGWKKPFIANNQNVKIYYCGKRIR